ncbi:GlxA family transcriptional regulator [Bowmanella dokdonensis]|uniref:Helix-turn-helix domain-containing protein n=1 Tax=Bowmanella dokdonensis TaxID=751969 RepID=A0A939DQN1_9ALTE|nr:helix-turn-helix domain-containing protein [Bowmanella dokdonensis]MBN7826959.1 helix-turn-helix domain-containing protein [Bowmanella dokdonensis]
MKTIGILVYDQIQAVDLAVALDTFGQVNEELKKLGREPFYRLLTLGLHTQSVKAEYGLSLQAEFSLDLVPKLDYLIIPGGAGARVLSKNPQVLDWIRTQSPSLQRLLTICTGAFLLAATGLMAGKKLCTHWRFAQALQAAYPDTKVDATALYVNDGKFYSSGGMTSGIDLCLAVIEEDLGLNIAQTVAQELVMYLRRNGDQSQYSRPLTVQNSEEKRFVQLQQWLLDNLHRPIGLADMADKMAMSERHFRRLFREKFALPPSQYLEQLRLDKARSLLLCDGYNLQRVCEAIGFASTSSFGRLFKQKFGCTPLEYSRRFT